MKRLFTSLFAAGLFLCLAEGVSAKAPNCGGGTRTRGINQRQQRQQRRIGQGVRSGELTGREMLRLESEQYQIQQEKREAKEDGRVTARERAGLHRELNQASRHIYRAKHNNRDRN